MSNRVDNLVNMLDGYVGDGGYHLNVNEELDALILVPKKGRNDDGTVPIISFDFKWWETRNA